MNTSDKRIWFPAKRYGWGWGFPCSWQGWVVFGVYVVLIGAGIAYFELPAETATFISYAFVITLALVVICWAKGEKARWRWGG